jgi:glycosyltransferase involved in cell wall biosynthesis
VSVGNDSPVEHGNAAIRFDPEGYTTSGDQLMGRQSAGEGFLRGFVRHAGAGTLFCYCDERPAAQAFANLCRGHGSGDRPVRWLRPDRFADIGAAGTLYLPDPALADMAWRRRRIGPRSFSLCGVTHTIASHRIMDSLVANQSAPVEPWDAVVCTSRPVMQSVKRLMEANAEYLRERFQARAVPGPALAQIPLGVDCDAFATDHAAGRRWRERLGIAEADVVFLFLGRLSFHAKANPYPMFVALERAAARVSARLHLVLAGRFPSDAIAREFHEAADRLCKSARVSFVDGRDPESRRIWHAADVFISLSDNIQESFGLTPVEAMAAGLPSVVSDWDGYRDTVRDGVDGYRIPTRMPPAPAGEALAARHEDGRDGYDRYIGNVSQFVAVDITACAEACARLANDAPLRRRMGDAARARARAEFDWSVVMRRYQELWSELGRLRSAAPSAGPAAPNPARADPYWLFADYPTALLGPTCVVRLFGNADFPRQQALRTSPLIAYGARVHPAEDLCRRIMEQLAGEGACTVSALERAAGPAGFPELARAIAWLNKLGLVEVSAPARQGDA